MPRRSTSASRRTASTEFTGPILTTNGHLTGLAYGNVTKYFDLARISTTSGSSRRAPPNCDTALGGLPDFTDLPAAAAGYFGDDRRRRARRVRLDDAVRAEGRTSTTRRVDASKAKLRFIHASPGTPPVDVGLGGGALFTGVFTDIAYGNAASTTNGYITTDAIHGAEISARAHGTLVDALAIKPAELPAGAIATAIAIGYADDASLRVLLCVDNAPPNALLSQCQIVGGKPERAHVRIAHLSPDTPAVDVCLAPAGTNAYDKSLLKTLGVTDGLSYPQVTTYVDLPVGMYDARIIHATATGCSIGAVPDAMGIAHPHRPHRDDRRDRRARSHRRGGEQSGAPPRAVR